MDRQAYINLVEDYFAALDQRRLEDVLTYFNKECVFTVQSAFLVFNGHSGVKEMFDQFLETYEQIVHTDFEHIVDPISESISSRFRVELDRFDGGHETKQSVNHWYFDGDKFQRVYVWISGDNVLGA